MIGKLYGRTTKAVNRRAASLIRNAARRTLSITVDHGTEFHGYEKAIGAKIYFATPTTRGSAVRTRTPTG
jgi:IS30 family transposase